MSGILVFIKEYSKGKPSEQQLGLKFLDRNGYVTACQAHGCIIGGQGKGLNIGSDRRGPVASEQLAGESDGDNEDGANISIDRKHWRLDMLVGRLVRHYPKITLNRRPILLMNEVLDFRQEARAAERGSRL
jgi:hypothetical protein